MLCAFLGGFFWAVFCAQQRLSVELPRELVGENILVDGIVSSIPDIDEQRTRFEFVIEAQHDSERHLPLPFKTRLSWYRRGDTALPEIKVGQQWQLLIRLKPPSGFMNPGGFDYESWLFRHNIRATGYVREHQDNTLLQSEGWRYGLSAIRAELLNRLKQLSGDLRYRGVLLALSLGYRDAISDSDWQLLLHTGTNHLMAISGLHIGLVAGLLYFCALGLIGYCRVRGWLGTASWPAQRTAALLAWGGALVYAVLAGFALPAQRAFIMLTVGIFAVVAYRQLSPAQSLVLALVAVLLLDPFAVQAAGFWLSFAAVAVLIYTFNGRRRHMPLRNKIMAVITGWGRAQWVLLVGLLPLTLYWFGGAAMTATAANLIAIPLVGMLVVPLGLLATLFCPLLPAIATSLLWLANLCLTGLWPLLELMQQLPLSHWEQPQPPLWYMGLAMVGAMLLLAPRGWPVRWIGVFWFAPLLFYQPARPDTGAFFLTVLDVGQGSAMVIQTAHHSLIYDTGPKFNDGFDSGRLVVLPFLRQAGIDRVDTMIVSHGDNDHIGGSAAIIDSMPVARIISSVPRRFAGEAVESCRDGRHWSWDGVRFSILHPDRKVHWEGNNSSCVLLVETGVTRVLLNGDIEKPVEQRLLREHQLQPVSVLFAPHHGSRTSSTESFVRAVQPEHVVFNAGLYNRYGFPKPDVLARYRKTGARLWTTGEQGALQFYVSEKGAELRSRYRVAARRYWHFRPH